MIRSTVRALLLWTALLLFAVTGAVSAMQMTPDRAGLERAQALAFLDGDQGDLCGIGSEASRHRCPLCHALPGAPRVTAPSAGIGLNWTQVAWASADLVTGPQHLGAHVTTRAPPRGSRPVA